jgi:diguanylate cyclase (GGDEF)-like protein
MPEKSLVNVHFARHPFTKEGLAKRTLPFALPVLLSFAVVWMPSNVEHQIEYLRWGIGLTVALLAAVFVVPWDRIPSWLSAIPPLTHIVIIFLMREGLGIPIPMFAPLLLLPLFWLSLYGSRKQLLVGFLVVGGAYAITRWGESYEPDQLKFVAMACLTLPVVCFTAQELVMTVRSQARELEALAHRDELTGAANRREWDAALPREIARATRHKRPLAIALLDLDEFKELNDEHGHQAGDLVLKESVAAWRDHLRGGDILARIGGDEFAVLLPECDPSAAEEIVERLRRSTARGLTVSVGVACWAGQEEAAELILRADRALYQAKEGGRNRSIIDGDEGSRHPKKKTTRRKTAAKKPATTRRVKKTSSPS